MYFFFTSDLFLICFSCIFYALSKLVSVSTNVFFDNFICISHVFLMYFSFACDVFLMYFSSISWEDVSQVEHSGRRMAGNQPAASQECFPCPTNPINAVSPVQCSALHCSAVQDSKVQCNAGHPLSFHPINALHPCMMLDIWNMHFRAWQHTLWNALDCIALCIACNILAV